MKANIHVTVTTGSTLINTHTLGPATHLELHQMFFCRLRFKWICYDSFSRLQNFSFKLSVCRCHCVHSTNSSTKQNGTSQREWIDRRKKCEKEHTAHVHENVCRPESVRWSCYIYIKLYKFDVFFSHLEFVFKIPLHLGLKYGMCDKRKKHEAQHWWLCLNISLSSLPRFGFEREKLSTPTTINGSKTFYQREEKKYI